ncbi:hypothetical protein HY251_17870 [bacterium]|nr:hypothetical protein [bacterium]
MPRTRRTGPATAALLALALTLGPGCAAYDGRYWSFPFNSNQMVENAALYDWTYWKAFGAELAFQLFPLSWIWSIFDLALLPLTVSYDIYAAASGTGKPKPFLDQVETEKRKGLEANPVNPSGARKAVREGEESHRLDPTDR